VKGLDTSLYEPYVLFHGPNHYCAQFEALGAKVILLNDLRPPTPPHSISSRLRETIGSEFVYRATRPLRRLVRRDLPIARRLSRLIREEGIDLVHLNSHLLSDRDAAIGARLAGVPQVCHVRWLHDYSATSTEYWIDRALSRWVSRFIYMSKAIEKTYLDLGVPPSKGEVIDDPFELTEPLRESRAREVRSEFGLDDGERLVTNVGRVVEWKGHDYFVRAFAKVARSMPNVRAMIVGGADDGAYYDSLRQMVADLGLSGRVIFTGFRHDVDRIMAASDVIVHSSSMPEPFGRVVVEAMASGRPVVGTAAGGVPEIVEDGVTGLLVPPRDEARMAESIERLLENASWANSVGERGRQYVRTRFTVARHVAAVQCIYDSILKDTQGVKGRAPSLSSGEDQPAPEGEYRRG
jgi:glycosyltransferase involved in cell wall biosynthesis